MGFGGSDGEPLRGTRIAGETLDRGPAKPNRWRLALVLLLRLLSIAWMVKGLMAWAIILGIDPSQTRPFENQLLSFQAIVVYFAVIDLVAAVGLWLTSTWGGVVWLLAAVSQILLGFFFPRLLPLSTVVIGCYLALIAAYFIATWLAEREQP